MDSRTAPSSRAVTVSARLVAVVAVLFAAAVLVAPAAALAATTSVHRGAGHHVSAVTVPVADKHGGMPRVDLPQVLAPAPPCPHPHAVPARTADASSISLLATADAQRTRGPPSDDRG
jgi:hypothetical protein